MKLNSETMHSSITSEPHLEHFQQSGLNVVGLDGNAEAKG